MPRIDVEVTDKSGKPIKGLSADKFSITDDGKPQNISSFSYFDIESIETAGAGDANAAPIVVSVDNEGPNTPSAEKASEPLQNRRLLVLFFDLTSMQTDDRFVNCRLSGWKMSRSRMLSGIQLGKWAKRLRLIRLPYLTKAWR